MGTIGLEFMDGGDKIAPLECVSRYEDVGHETIIRELTQNALDAARKIKTSCNLQIEIRSISTHELPGIETYRQHLDEDGMQEWQERKQSKYDDALAKLRRLSQAKTLTCLMVLDNGVGLNSHTMEGLIGKGDTMKNESDGGSGGTHGVGHETTFAAGDMNYVIYGGVNREQGRPRRVASGHVVFPTHIHNGKRYGGHGYLTHNAHQLTLSGVAIIEEDNQISPLIQQQLDKIEQSSGTGSVVIVPAFNGFPEETQNSTHYCQLICEDIAKHFFVAIAQNRLNVTVNDYTKTGGGAFS